MQAAGLWGRSKQPAGLGSVSTALSSFRRFLRSGSVQTGPSRSALYLSRPVQIPRRSCTATRTEAP